MNGKKQITLISFGFKYGQPNANNYFDVSFIKNPARQDKWGLFSDPDEEMTKFVTDQDAYKKFIKAVIPLIEVMVELDDGMKIGFGCSAGRHRSYIVAEEITKILRKNGHEVRVIHREME